MINRYIPHGVVGVIGPWNYPLLNNFGDAIPALMAGNCVILKPASMTPLSSLLIAEGMREVGVPEDVFLVATGSGSTAGRALVDSVDMLHFTGSTKVGKQLMEQAAKRLLPVTLEVGGKDPMIVLRGANLERAANAAVWGALQNVGQTCISIERVYVETDAYEPYLARVLEKVARRRQAPPMVPARSISAQLHLPSRSTSSRSTFATRSRKAPRSKREAGCLPGPSCFFEPTVLTNVDHSMKIMREETFGPILPIMRVQSEEEAVRLANDSSMGLDSSVFAANPSHGERVARQVECGAVIVNDVIANYLALEIPIGGVKDSGVGARHGRIGIQKYCKRQNLVVTRLGLNRELYYFPYTKAAAKLTEWLMVALYGRGSRRR